MGKWGTSAFVDVLTIINGKNQKQVESPNGRYPIYGSGGVMGYADSYLCEADTVVIGRKGTINKPIFVQKPFWNVDTAFGLRAHDSKLFPKYLFYFCEQFDFEKLNTTVTIPSLTKANLLKIQIPLPPLPVQQQIADVLDCTNTLIVKRKAQIDKLELLVKSQFLNMFDSAYERYQLMNLPKLCDFIDYRGKTPEKSNVGIPLITAKNVKDNRFSIEPQEYIPTENYNTVMTRGIPSINDVLFTTEAPLGNVCRIPALFDKFCIGQRIITMKPHDAIITSEYLERALLTKRFQDNMWKRSSGSTVKGIRSKELALLSIPVPPIVLQQIFSDFVHQVEAQKQLLQSSLEQLERNYKSLLQKCFRGDIF